MAQQDSHDLDTRSSEDPWIAIVATLHLCGLTAPPGAGEVDAGLLEGAAEDVGVGPLGQQPVDRVLAGVHGTWKM